MQVFGTSWRRDHTSRDYMVPLHLSISLLPSCYKNVQKNMCPSAKPLDTLGIVLLESPTSGATGRDVRFSSFYRSVGGYYTSIILLEISLSCQGLPSEISDPTNVEKGPNGLCSSITYHYCNYSLY